MSTVLAGTLLVEILPNAGNRLYRPTSGMRHPGSDDVPRLERPRGLALRRDGELQLVRAAIADGRAIEFHAPSVIRGANGLKSDIAQVVPLRTRPRREGQKRQRGEVVAGSAPRSAVCVADGPQVTRPR